MRPWLSEHHWQRVSFILEAEGAIFCFIIYLIPGFPKDIVSYLFGISPMPFWLFAVVSTVARIPGTWISSYFGAHVAEQQYIYAIAFMAVVVALCLPLYYHRDRIDDDEKKAVADLRAKGMQVVENVDKAKFQATLTPVYADFGKRFGQENIDRIKNTR